MVPFENHGIGIKRVLAGELLGQLEPVNKIYNSADIASSALTDELVQGIISETGANRLELLLNLLPQPECLLNESQRLSLNKLLNEFADVFALNSSELGRTDLVQHAIGLTDQRPIRHPPRLVPFALREKVDSSLELALFKPNRPREKER